MADSNAGKSKGLRMQIEVSSTTDQGAPAQVSESAPTPQANPIPRGSAPQVRVQETQGAESEWDESAAQREQQANGQASATQAQQSQGEQQAQQGTKGTSQGPTLRDAQRAAAGWVHRTFPGHEHAFYGAVVAIIVALLVFAIGFARMLFVCVLVVVGVAVGQIFDGDPKIIRTIRELFSNEGGQR